MGRLRRKKQSLIVMTERKTTPYGENMEHGFSWNAEQYAQTNTLQTSIGEQFIDTIPFSPEMSVLDAGCGDGNLSILMAKKVPYGKVTAIDLSESMIRKAEASAAAQAMQNLKFRVCGINELAYDREFDLLFSNSVLHWVTEIEDGIRRFYRALKQDGILCVQFPLLNAEHPLIRYAMRAVQELGVQECCSRNVFPWYVPDSAEQFACVLKEAGFLEVKASLESGIFSFPSAEAVYQHFSSVGLNLFAETMDENDGKIFAQKVLQDLKEDFPGTAELRYERIYAKAVKRKES